MSRFKRATNRGNWSPEDMQEAVEAVINESMVVREAAERFNVPKSTLQDRVQAVRKGGNIRYEAKLGRYNTIFTPQQEEELKRYVLDLDKQMMPLSIDEFKKLAFDLAVKLNLEDNFNKEMQKAGNSFYYGFLKRHPEMSLRKPNKRCIDGVDRFTPEEVKKEKAKEKQKLQEKTVTKTDENTRAALEAIMPLPIRKPEEKGHQ